MLRKLSAFILFIMAASAVVFAQQTPEPADKRLNQIIIGAPFEGSYLGVQAQDVSKENLAKYGLSTVRGVAIEKVIENSPAAQAGLMNNDVIVKFNGEEVTSVRKLTRLISEVAPDHAARITILRGGSEREINVTLGKREMPKFFNGNFNFENLPATPAIPPIPEIPDTPLPSMKNGEPNVFVWREGANRQIGVGVSPLTKQLGDYFGIAEGKGLLINNVRENSPAAKAGLKAGDVIVEVNGKEVNGNFDLIRAVIDKKEGDVSLTIIRNRNRQTVNVSPETIKGGTLNLNDLEKLEVGPNSMNFKMQVPKPRIAPMPRIEILNTPRIL